MNNQAPLPDGVTRSEHAATHVTLQTCHAIQFQLEPEGGATSSCLIVWRDGPKYAKPVEKGKRLRDLRAGDLIEHKGRTLKITGVEIYR